MDDCEYKFMPDANAIFFIKEEIEIKEEFIDDYAAEVFETSESENGNANFLSTDDIKSEDCSILAENTEDINEHKTQVDQELIKSEECELGNAHFLSTDYIKSEDSSMFDFTEENAEDDKDQHETQVDEELIENVKSDLQNNEKTSVEDHSTSNSSLEIILTARGKRCEVSLEFDADAYSDSQYKVVNESFKCILCDIILRDVDEARHHALVHFKKFYKCPENCKFTTEYLKKFRTHLLKHGNKTTTNVKIIETNGGKPYEIRPEFDVDDYVDSQCKIVDKSFECKQCGKKSQSIYIARSHALIHSEKKLYKCPENCEFETNYLLSLRTHLWNHEKIISRLEIIVTAEGKRYEIKPEFDADAYSVNQYRLVNKSFTCKHCFKKSRDIYKARIHALTHSEVKLYKCPENCEFETNYLLSLRTHLWNHEKIISRLEIIVTAEGKRYEIKPEFDADAYSVNQYRLVNKSFTCKHCFKKSRDIYKARIHALTHSEVKLYKCPENCEFETNYFKSLRTHLSNHEKSKYR